MRRFVLALVAGLAAACSGGGEPRPAPAPPPPPDIEARPPAERVLELTCSQGFGLGGLSGDWRGASFRLGPLRFLDLRRRVRQAPDAIRLVLIVAPRARADVLVAPEQGVRGGFFNPAADRGDPARGATRARIRGCEQPIDPDVNGGVRGIGMVLPLALERRACVRLTVRARGRSHARNVGMGARCGRPGR